VLPQARSNAQQCRSKSYLGFDCSTQGLKVTAINEQLDVVYNTAINFGKDLPQFVPPEGVNDRGGGVINQPTVMFCAALDKVLGQMKADGFDFGDVASISGSGQQHGSVYWAKGASETLRTLKINESLESQLALAFSVPDSPIWMDSSTGAQCAALEDSLGGAEATADLTGSRAYERFTGNQIAKVASQNADAYDQTERISLISSFMPSLLLGSYCPIDASDAGGMNLMDLRAQQWSDAAVAATAPGLMPRLGDIALSHTVAGTVSDYLQQTYGFQAGCQVVTWSGDNPCSVAGLGLNQPGDIGLSMGTSDTIFGITGATESSPGLEGHVFVNPVDPASHMVMLCYKNGSLVRERVCERTTGVKGDWQTFDKLLAETAPGNEGNLGFFFDFPEITPDVPLAGTRFFDASGVKLDSLAPAVEARAVLEGQFMSMRVHAGNLGLASQQVIVTGGASQNSSITQTISNVFGVPVRAASQPDSASLGAAYRAMHANECTSRGEFVPYVDVVGNLSQDYKTVAKPNITAHETYTAMMDHYRSCEAKVIAEC